MEKEKILAGLQSKIWFLHDEKNFNELTRMASNLFLELGFEKKKSIVAGECVSKSYFLYDKAGEEDKKGNIKRREYYFKKMLEYQIKTRKILNEDIRTAYLENKWWICFHYRKYLKQFPYMLRQQMIKYDGYNPLLPLQAVYYLIKAGLEGHNKRDIHIAEKYLENYWRIVLLHMKDKIQY